MFKRLTSPIAIILLAGLTATPALAQRETSDQAMKDDR